MGQARASRLRRPDVLSGGAEPQVGPSPKRYATGQVPPAPGGVRGHPAGLRAHGGATGDVVSVAFSIGPSGRCASTHSLKSKLPRFSMPRPQRCGAERGWDGIFR